MHEAYNVFINFFKTSIQHACFEMTNVLQKWLSTEMVERIMQQTESLCHNC